MKFCVLASGSKGNSTYLDSGEVRILIDAGLSGIELQRRLSTIGVQLADIDAILVTHEHNDHISGVGVLSRRAKIPVYANPETFSASSGKVGKLSSYNEFETGGTFEIRNLQIHPFAISHDAQNPVGFRIFDGRATLGYCTDTGKISRLIRHRLGSCQALVLESNHDVEMLQNGSYPPYLKQRIRSSQGHLDNHEASLLLQDLLHEKLEHVVLAHLSEENNDPEIAYRAAMAVVNGYFHSGEIDMRISVANQYCTGELFSLK
ncbi:MAG: MBL fold metallo-hydrolase [Deltaproteobacteria bacterium]|jgi:phosphoribosyl 1,2-cyclic phosphodiesterase|nr:MBL fold metallo-hydrolase [Deltaproteobacteria bacterium]